MGSNFTKVMNDIIPQQPLNVHNGLPLGFALQITWIALNQSKPEPNQEHLEDHQSQIMLFRLQNKSQGHLVYQEVVGIWESWREVKFWMLKFCKDLVFVTLWSILLSIKWLGILPMDPLISFNVLKPFLVHLCDHNTSVSFAAF